jgi:hypothetical protein
MPVVDLLGPDYAVAERLDATPVCGEDFCDHCGDCLHCYGGDACRDELGHGWCVYAENVEEWRAKHPDAKPWPPVEDEGGEQ